MARAACTPSRLRGRTDGGPCAGLTQGDPPECGVPALPCCLNLFHPVFPREPHGHCRHLWGHSRGMPNEGSAWPRHGAQAGTDGPSLPIFINYWLHGPRLAREPQALWLRRRPSSSGGRDGSSFNSAGVVSQLPLSHRHFWLSVVPGVLGRGRGGARVCSYHLPEGTGRGAGTGQAQRDLRTPAQGARKTPEPGTQLSVSPRSAPRRGHLALKGP